MTNATVNAAALGTQVGQLAVQHAVNTGNTFAAIRTGFIRSKDATAYVTTLFEAAYAVKGAKASWLRSYKCRFTDAAKYDIALTDTMSAGELAKLVKAAKSAAMPEDEALAQSLARAASFAKCYLKLPGATRKALNAAITDAMTED